MNWAGQCTWPGPVFAPIFVGTTQRKAATAVTTRRETTDYRPSAVSIAFSRALALFIDSWYSLDGTESATIPAPACK
jgi:hypothetical protein